MSRIIAITGKGGCGKTTLAACFTRSLIDSKQKPVLAVDADPNSCLDLALGVSVSHSLGTIREEARSEAQKNPALSKREFLDMRISQSLVEGNDFDFLSMGRPEGPGCYCYANNILSDVLRRLTAAYPFTIIDNEAGLENLSRRIVQSVDTLVLVAEPSAAGIRTVERLISLAREMKVECQRLVIAVNRVRDGKIPDGIQALKTQTPSAEIVTFPFDEEIARMSENGRSVFSLPADNPVLRETARMVERLV